MSRNRIGGSVDSSALAALTRPERLFRPADSETLAREARLLADQNLTVYDISRCLQLSPATVRELLEGDNRD